MAAPITLDRVAANHPAASKGIRIFRRAQREARRCLETGAIDRLPHLVGLIHLAATHTEVLEPEARRLLLVESSSLLKEIFDVGVFDPRQRLESSAPSAFFISYPRSGNTLLTQLLAGLFQGQILENMEGALVPFSKKCYAKDYPLTRIIKDHVAHDYYEDDKCVFIVRDGRDTLLSLGYMTLQQGMHEFRKKSELPDLVHWFAEKYAFGDWASHANSVRRLMESGNKMLVTYDEATTSAKVFTDAARFLDPDHYFPDDWFERSFNNRDMIFDNIKKNPFANQTWGIGASFEEDDIFYEWSKNRKGSNWRETFTPEARKAFHDSGATESLIAFGFEDDPEWWKH